MTAVEWSQRGFGDLIPVIPPGVEIAKNSSLPKDAAGKAPGVRRDDGKWVGLADWRQKKVSSDRIDSMGANLGLRTRTYPCLDVDVLDAGLVELIHVVAEEYLGMILPCWRVGAAPKRAYIFRLSGAPFERIRREWMYKGRRCLVEFLGDGQQVVIDGTHRSGRPYEWSEYPTADGLVSIDAETAEGLMDAIAVEMEGLGCTVLSSTSAHSDRPEVDQARLMGKIDKVRAAVSACPNTIETYPGRDSYLKMSYAIKAACQEDDEAGYEIFEAWGLPWPDATPEGLRAHWDSLRGPYTIGAEYIYSQARRFGWGDAADDFEVVQTEEKRKETTAGPVEYSDMWLAERFIEEHGAEVRYDQDSKRWYRCRNGIWQPDAAGVTELVMETCVGAADEVCRRGSTDKEKMANLTKAKSLNSRRTVADLMALASSMRSVSVRSTDFDPNPDLIGVPGGVVDLRTGEMLPPSPDLMISRSTSVAPVDAPTPIWDGFLQQATGSNQEYVDYLERAAGYTLTGHTREHKFFYLYGNGGTGKSTFLDVLYSILGDFAHAADSGLFLDSRERQHTQELAATQGRRLVSVNEIKKGRAWNEARLKALTGGDVVNARHMYGSDYNFRLAAKFWMAANNRPVFTGIDEGISRRVQILPFVHKPEVIDKELPHKLRAEYPAILRKLILAAGDWYREGLVEASAVVTETAEYIAHEDLVAQWRAECCEPAASPAEWSRSSDLWSSWNDWNVKNGRKPMSTQGFATILRDHSIKKIERATGSYWEGLKLAGGRTEFEVVQ